MVLTKTLGQTPGAVKPGRAALLLGILIVPGGLIALPLLWWLDRRSHLKAHAA